MPEFYAERMNADGTTTRYRTRAQYERGRFQATGTAAATRAKIRRALDRVR